MPFKDPEKQRESDRKYSKSEKGRARHRRYNNSPKGKEKYREWIESHPPIRMFGEKVYMPDREFAEFAIALREERRDARS